MITKFNCSQFLNIYSTLGSKELFELEPMEKLQTVRILIHVVSDCGDVEEYAAELEAECSTLWKRRKELQQRRRAAEKAQADKDKEKEKVKASPNQAEKNKENLADGPATSSSSATASIPLLPPVSPAAANGVYSSTAVNKRYIIHKHKSYTVCTTYTVCT